MSDTEQPAISIESSSSSVLNISGRVPRDPGLPRKKFPKPVIPLPKTKPESAPPTINVNTFEGIISKILLKYDEAPPNPQINKSTDQIEYLAVLCLINTVANTRIYHMFCSNQKDLKKDYEKITKLYENQKDIKIENQVSIQTMTARALYRSAQRNLKEYKWSREGNIFETPCVAERDEYFLSNRLHELHNAEMEKLFNYIKFLSIHKQ